MKISKIFSLLILAVSVFACSKGADSIDKAFDIAKQKGSAIEVANTLCNGDINCMTLTEDESAKLGACIEYITFYKVNTPDFSKDVDTAKYEEIVKSYNNLAATANKSSKKKTDELIKEMLE